MNQPASKASGACLCGGVQFKVDGNLRPVVYCHCEQCRRTSGHFVAATACAIEALTLQRQETLRWFRSSPSARRGFCQECGASLFWQADDKAYVAIMAGCLDAPTGLRAKQHIFTANAGDYYQIDDGLPCGQQDELDW